MSKQPPVESRTIIRILVVLVVILSLAAGYYHSSQQVTQRKLRSLQADLETVEAAIGETQLETILESPAVE